VAVTQPEPSISEVGVALLHQAPADDDLPDEDMVSAVVDEDDFDAPPSVSADVVAYATVGLFSVTTGYAQRLRVTLEQGASSSEITADVREYLDASGWWELLCDHLAREAGIVVAAEQLDQMLGPIHCTPALREQLREETD
jgi:hypothetical protein